MGLERVTKRSIAVHHVTVAASAASLVDVASLLQLAQDPLDRALGDSDLVAKRTDGEVGVLRDA